MSALFFVPNTSFNLEVYQYRKIKKSNNVKRFIVSSKTNFTCSCRNSWNTIKSTYVIFFNKSTKNWYVILYNQGCKKCGKNAVKFKTYQFTIDKIEEKIIDIFEKKLDINSRVRTKFSS